MMTLRTPVSPTSRVCLAIFLLLATSLSITTAIPVLADPAQDAIGPEPETQCAPYLVKEKSFSFYFKGSCQDLVGRFPLGVLPQRLSAACLTVFGASSSEPPTTWACPDRIWNQKADRYDRVVCMSCGDGKGGPGYCTAEEGSVPLSCRISYLSDYRAGGSSPGMQGSLSYCRVAAEISGDCRYSCSAS